MRKKLLIGLSFTISVNQFISTQGLFLATRRDFSDKIELGAAIQANKFSSFSTQFNVSGDSLRLFLIDSANTVLSASSINLNNNQNFYQAYPDGSGDFYAGYSGTKMPQTIQIGIQMWS